MQQLEESSDGFVNKLNSDQIAYMKHIGILVIGGLLGFVAAYFLNLYLVYFDFSADINKARSLGIVSLTILNGYPKSKDIVSYASILGFPVLVSIALWYIWARSYKDRLAAMFESGNPAPLIKKKDWAISVVAVVLFYLYASFELNRFYSPGWNPDVGAWIFLGEDGENLAWVQSIFSGGVYGKDFFCLYGPMFIYPLAAIMKIFGATVAVERFYKYFLDLVAYSIVIFFLYKTVQSKAIFVVSSVVYFLVFPMFYSISVNFTHLRFVLGILPLALLYIYFGNGKKYLLPIVGAVIGQSLLFSQETGIAACIAVFGTLFICFLSDHQWRSFLRHSLLVAGGCLLSISPMIAYISWKGAFISLLDSLYGFPKLAALGSGGVPAPPLEEFISNPFGDAFFYYWAILLYVFSSIYLISRVLINKPNRNDLLRLSLLIFGVILYVIAVRRPIDESIHKAFHPVLLLIFLLIDDALTGIIARRNIVRLGHTVLFVGLILFTFALFVESGFVKMMIDRSEAALIPADKLSRVPLGYRIPSVKRGGIYFDKGTALSILLIKDFLEKNTRQGDYVYFFPNEAVYYFLFDRNNPTRYAISYFAITADQRKDLIADLERNKPVYIIYSKNTWRIDDIAEGIQEPEVVAYINMKYRVDTDKENIQIWKRKDL